MTTPQDLRLLNDLFDTSLQDVDAIDTTYLWETVEQELRQAVAHQARYVPGVTAKRQETYMQVFRYWYLDHLSYAAIGRMTNLSGNRVGDIVSINRRRLRHPERLARIKSACPGWFNAYKPVPKPVVKPKPVPKFKFIDATTLYYVPAFRPRCQLWYRQPKVHRKP
jgi:hypothetical protein